jgi:hypothetical protein
MGAEAAMSNALAGVSRPDGVKRLFIVLCAPLLLAVLFYVRHTTYFKDGRVNEVPPATIGGAPWILLWER